MRLFFTKPGRSSFVLAAVILATAWTALAGEKTDKIGLRNGDRLTCEVKKLESGLLLVSTDDLGSVSIEWDKIVFLESKELYEIDMSNGATHFGSLGNTTTPTLLSITSDTLTVIVARQEVVKLLPIKTGFFQRLDGSFSLGFSYTKASSLFQLNTSADVTHRARKVETRATLNSVITVQSDEDQTQRFDFTLDQRHLFEHRWFLVAGVGMQKNTALGLDLRLSLEGSGGNLLFRTNSEWFALGGGLSANREWVTSDSGDSYNLEAFASISHSKFRYDRPHLNLSTSIVPYLNLTHFGRYRLEFNTNISIEILADFYVKLSLYDSFNSDPPPDAVRNDWNTTFSLSYSL